MFLISFYAVVLMKSIPFIRCSLSSDEELTPIADIRM